MLYIDMLPTLCKYAADASSLHSETEMNQLFPNEMFDHNWPTINAKNRYQFTRQAPSNPHNLTPNLVKEDRTVIWCIHHEV